jgi:ATP-dependent helicase/nuclease subunit A
LDRRFEEAAAKLKAWRQIADFLPPYELYTEILEKHRMRERLLARLGVEASEAIDELLDMALAYDDRAPASLAGFLSSLATSRHEVKRDLEHGRNDIRILTVHGSKGLEAPVVFLPDTAATAKPRPGALVRLASDRGGLPLAVWCVPGASRLPPIREARDAVAAREAEEADRLLYVAMTRARDRLYVGGWETAKARTPDCWYDKIRRALDPELSALTLADGRVVHRLDTEQTAVHDEQKKDHHGAVPPAEPPQWAQTPVRAEPQAAVPVAPSRLAPLDVADAVALGEKLFQTIGEQHAAHHQGHNERRTYPGLGAVLAGGLKTG